MAARSYRRLKRYSNSARQRGTCLALIARYVPVIDALMLPSAVLAHLKAGIRAAAAPLPVTMTWCEHPASATPPKQRMPSPTTARPGARLVLEGGDRVGAETRHTPELEANRPGRSRGLNRRDEWGLASGASSTPGPGALTAETGVVDLDATGQLPGSIAFEHDLRELVPDLPCRGLGDAEAAAELDAGDALLGLRHVVERAKPGAQRQLGRGEDRACDR